MIETWDLGKTYRPPFGGLLPLGRPAWKTEALHGVTLQVAAGEVFGLLGPNGAGKTTLLRLLATLIPPSRGRGRVGGGDLASEAHKVRRATAFASGEERGFYWRLTGRENLEFFAGLLGLSPGAARSRVSEVLELMDLLPMAHQRVTQYSTGMRQRLGIGRALLGTPAVLLLDEPTRSLDPVIASSLTALVGRLAAERGTTVVFATHNLEEAERICQRVAVLVDGRVRAIENMGGHDQGLPQRYRDIVAAR